jgi:RHS repeat-associated protein
LYEEDRDASGNVVEQRSYIMANGKPIVAVVQDAGGNKQLQYLYTDYLGSLLLSTDENGNPLFEQNFDAWGNHRDPNTWQAQPGTSQPSLGDRGYTFHEHLPQFALIKMNGRMYDPVLGRFLSPDPYVQAPTNTQSYNRYSYVLNNPLKYTDPSGEIIVLPAVAVGAILGVVMGATSYAASVAITGSQWNWGAFSMSVLGGAVTGGILGLVSPASVSVFLTGQGLANAAAGGVLGVFAPSYSIPMGEWSINLSPSIFMGNSSGLGLNIGASYSNGKGFQFAFGYSFTAFGSFPGTNASTFEQRFSGSIGYSSKGFGVSAGFTQFYHESGSKWNQRVGRLSIMSGEFSFSYENDGFPFSFGLADGGDKMRTAAAHVGYKNFGIGFNLITGDPFVGKDYDTEPVPNHFSHPDLVDEYGNITHRGGQYISGSADEYRMGAVYMNVGAARLGNDSEHNRHMIQNRFAHSIRTKWLTTYQPWFRYREDISSQSYFQYQNNPFSLW